MKFSKTELGYVVRLEPGEEVLSAISSFAGARGIGSAAVSGIGAVADVTLGYFDRAKKDYVKKTLRGEYEVLSIAGNVSYFNGEPWVHVHTVMAGPDFEAIGGHLFSARVTVTVELCLAVSRKKIERREDSATGFRHLALEDFLS